MSRPTVWRVLAVAWSLTLLALASIPGERVPEPLLFSTDSLRHALAFAVLVWLWGLAWPGRGWAVAAGAFAFGVGIEVWQQVLPIGRVADATDVVANAMGIAAGLAGVAVWRRIARRA